MSLLALKRFVYQNNYLKLYCVVLPQNSIRHYTSANGEKRISDLLKQHLNVHSISVQDISGGCGAMYEVFVSSSDFKGKRMIQQHRLVNEILKEEVKNMHGLRLQTSVPDDEETT